MARTPSMTAAEAEAALGPRGHLSVTQENRPLVRKWLVATGFPSTFVCGLSFTELGLAYNQTDGAMLDKLRQKLDKARAEIGEVADESEDESPVIEAKPIANGNGNGHANGDIAT